MSDSDDDMDMMPGLGGGTKVAKAGAAVDSDLSLPGAKEAAAAAEAEKAEAEAEPALPDVVVESSTAGNAAVKTEPVAKPAKRQRGKKSRQSKLAAAGWVATQPKAAEPTPDASAVAEKKDVEKPKPVEKNKEYLSVHTDKKRFVSGWADVVRRFAEDPSQTEYICPTDLNGYDRKLLHSLAEEFNLGHNSRGQGAERRLILSKGKLFYSLGGGTVTDENLKRLEDWQDMTKRYVPDMALPSKQAEEDSGEYVPGETADIMAEAGQKRREAEDRRARAERLKMFRKMNAMGCFLDAGVEGVAVPRAAPPAAALQPLPVMAPHLPFLGGMPPPAGMRMPAPFDPLAPLQPLPEPPSLHAVSTPPPMPGLKRPRDDAADAIATAAKKEKRADGSAAAVAGVDDAMKKFLESGLAPRTVSVRRSPEEPLGLRFTKELLVTAVTGPSERCGVPVDMFINEVNGVDVNTPNEFTKAIKNQGSFTLTLWYLRKDGYTVQKLKDIARKAEEMLQQAVEGDAGGATLMQTCTVCESSVLLVGEAWEGERKQPCKGCGEDTPWVVETFDEDDDEDDDDDSPPQTASGAPSPVPMPAGGIVNF